MADNQVHPNIQEMQKLADEYGADALMQATGYTIGSLYQYLRPNGKVIPDKKLQIARTFLEATKK